MRAGVQVEAIVIGASAGGIRALLALLAPLPAGFRLPIVVVVHVPAGRESKLVAVFQHHLELPVQQAQDRAPVAAGHVYFAGPGYHLSIECDRRFSLSCEAPVHYSRPAIDLLMGSAADAYGAGLVGVLLTGANADGAQGLASIHAAGGVTLVQDPTEAEMPIMPQAAIDYCPAHKVLSLRDIHALIVELEKPDAG